MAEKFEYTREWTDAEAFPLLGFTKSWENPEDYPTIELDETQVRKDMQSLHDEVKDYINTKLIPAVLAEDATEAARAAAEAQREANEAQRIENENARSEAEGSRSTAEQGRVAAEEARAAAERARVSAEAARGTAEQARKDAEQARADENTGIVARATEQANIASSAASSASNSASEASISKTAAQASKTAAAGSASAAANSATSASASASAASESADAAAASKTAAKSSEETAKASETAAKASETAAAESASAAQQSATSAAESAAVYESVASDVTQLKQDIDTLNQGGLNLKEDFIGEQVNKWLDEHPEATTTVQDGVITEPKIHSNFLPYIKNGYVTPQMFGAKGDGVADDTNAIQSAYDFVLEKFYASANEYSDNQMQVLLPKGSYKVTQTIRISPFVKTKTNGFARILSYVNDVCIVFAHDSNSLDFLKTDNERFYQKGNAFDCHSGCVHIENMTNNDSIAFQIGGNNDDNFKKTYSLLKFDGISIAKFEIGFSIKSHRMYLTEFNNCIVRKCKKGFYFDNTNYDSGENIKITNTTFGACGHAIELKSTVMELTIYGCSFDFCQGVIYIDNSDEIQGRRFVTIDSCHIEGLCDKNHTSNFIGNYPFISEYVTKNTTNYNIPVISVVNTILMGHSYINHQNLFRGKQKLALKTLYFYFTQSYLDDNFNVFLSSFYLCDDNVIILENNVEYVDNFYIIPCSKSLNINENSRFENTDAVESMTTNTEYKGIKIIEKKANLNVSITEETNFKSGKSLCLSIPTLSDGMSEGFYMNAEIGTYDIKAGQRIINSIAFKLNNIDKTVALYTVTKFYDLENKEIAVKNKTSESNRRRTTGDWQRPYYLESCIAPEGSVKCVVTLSSSNSSGMRFSNADKLYISNLETYIN